MSFRNKEEKMKMARLKWGFVHVGVSGPWYWDIEKVEGVYRGKKSSEREENTLPNTVSRKKKLWVFYKGEICLTTRRRRRLRTWRGGGFRWWWWNLQGAHWRRSSAWLERPVEQKRISHPKRQNQDLSKKCKPFGGTRTRMDGLEIYGRGQNSFCVLGLCSSQD